MKIYEICIVLILVILLIKSVTPIIMMFINYNNDKLKLNVSVKKESIQNMTNLEFECFCKWLFEEDKNFKNVDLISSCSGSIDLILTAVNDEKIYAQCKRYDLIESYESGKLVAKKDLDFAIGRSTCQNIVGAMMENNIKTGYIITTGSIHANALEYMNKLKSNSDLNLQFFTMTDIFEILESRKDKKDYSLALEI